MDDTQIEVPGAVDVETVLARDPFYRLLGAWIGRPWILGVIAAFIVILMVLFGPSSDSRFIYTDF